MDDINQAPETAGTGEKHTLGNEAEVRFLAVNKSVPGKVDTGATTSSLHATKISVNGDQVSFHSPALSNNIITLPVSSHQEVHSADGGGNERPVVNLEIEIDGVHIGNAEFNLNDRSGMDNQILIGQNILKAGNFVVDVQQGEAPQGGDTVGDAFEPAVDRTAKIKEAIRVLRDSNVTLDEMMMYIQTEAIAKLQ